MQAEREPSATLTVIVGDNQRADYAQSATRAYCEGKAANIWCLKDMLIESKLEVNRSSSLDGKEGIG